MLVAEVDDLDLPLDVVHDPVRAREGLRLAVPGSACVLLLLLPLALPFSGCLGVRAAPVRDEELVARAAVLLDRRAAGREVELAALHRDDAAQHVDGRYALGVVVAVLADDLERAGAEPWRRLSTLSLAGQADVVGAADPCLALAALCDPPEGLLL